MDEYERAITEISMAKYSPYGETLSCLSDFSKVCDAAMLTSINLAENGQH